MQSTIVRFEFVFVALAILLKTTVTSESTTILEVVTNFTPGTVSMTILVIPVPVNAVFKVPVTVTSNIVCVTVTPTCFVMSCAAIVNVHSCKPLSLALEDLKHPSYFPIL